MARTLNLTVTGEQKIHCAGCGERIGNALRRLPGVQDVQASADTQKVVVTFDPDTVSADQVRAKSRTARLPSVTERETYDERADPRPRKRSSGPDERA